MVEGASLHAFETGESMINCGHVGQWIQDLLVLENHPWPPNSWVFT